MEPGGERDGLGLLPVTTTLTREKRTRAVAATTSGGVAFGGYEIHLGETRLDSGAAVQPFAPLDDGVVRRVRDVRVFGTYLHGAFEHAGVCAELFGLDAARRALEVRGLPSLGAWFAEHGRHVGDSGSCLNTRKPPSCTGKSCWPSRRSRSAGPAGFWWPTC